MQYFKIIYHKYHPIKKALTSRQGQQKEKRQNVIKNKKILKFSKKCYTYYICFPMPRRSFPYPETYVSA